jgi:hypothetical protein
MNAALKNKTFDIRNHIAQTPLDFSLKDGIPEFRNSGTEVEPESLKEGDMIYLSNPFRAKNIFTNKEEFIDNNLYGPAFVLSVNPPDASRISFRRDVDILIGSDRVSLMSTVWTFHKVVEK